MRELTIPPDRDFPVGHRAARKDHLLSETSGLVTHDRAWWKRAVSGHAPSRASIRPRTVGALAALAAIAVVAVVAVDARRGERSQAAAPVHAAVASLAPGQTQATTGQATLISIGVRLSARGRQRENVEIVGGNGSQRDLLREILAEMPGNALTRVAIVDKVYRGEAGVGLDFDSAGGDPLRSDWEEMLAAGAFRDLSAQRGLTPVVGLPPASAVSSETSPDAAARLSTKLRLAAAASGATIERMSVYRVGGLAPAVLLRVQDPAPFLRDRLSRFLEAFGDRWRSYDGTFVEVVDANDRFVWGAGTNPRVSHGSVGTRPDLAGCSPVLSHGTTPPPCPTD